MKLWAGNKKDKTAPEFLKQKEFKNFKNIYFLY
jgi:hypothetical protein